MPDTVKEKTYGFDNPILNDHQYRNEENGGEYDDPE